MAASCTLQTCRADEILSTQEKMGVHAQHLRSLILSRISYLPICEMSCFATNNPMRTIVILPSTESTLVHRWLKHTASSSYSVGDKVEDRMNPDDSSTTFPVFQLPWQAIGSTRIRTFFKFITTKYD